jgi:hypothetical protein
VASQRWADGEKVIGQDLACDDIGGAWVDTRDDVRAAIEGVAERGRVDRLAVGWLEPFGVTRDVDEARCT